MSIDYSTEDGRYYQALAVTENDHPPEGVEGPASRMPCLVTEDTSLDTSRIVTLRPPTTRTGNSSA